MVTKLYLSANIVFIIGAKLWDKQRGTTWNLFGFYLMYVNASPYYMIYGVFLLALICSYTGYKWTKERLLEHISVLSKGKLDAKIRAVTIV